MNKRLAIAVEEIDSEERVAEHFGRSEKFIVLEIDEQKLIIKKEDFFNPLSGDHGGACQLPGYIKQFNINTIIAGGMGNKAIANFQKYGIEIITAPGLLAEYAAELYINGNLSGYEACGHDHHHHHNHHDNEMVNNNKDKE